MYVYTHTYTLMIMYTGGTCKQARMRPAYKSLNYINDNDDIIITISILIIHCYINSINIFINRYYYRY